MTAPAVWNTCPGCGELIEVDEDASSDGDTLVCECGLVSIVSDDNTGDRQRELVPEDRLLEDVELGEAG